MGCGCRGCFGRLGCGRIWRILRSWRSAGCIGRRAEVWSGLAKNATEGIADARRIVPVTVVLVMGQVLPFFYFASIVIAASLKLRWLIFVLIHHMFLFGITSSGLIVLGSMAIGVCFAWLPRWLAVRRFRQDWRSALLHPFGILLLLAVQWYALVRKLGGGSVGWRGRVYGGGDERSQEERVGQ